MLFELPSPKILYQAMLDQNEQYDGRAYVCVKTTGIFCRLVCPARNPKFENCRFFETVVECLDAGYRPCRRCRPLVPAGQQAIADNNITVLLRALEREPGKRWYESDIVQLGLDPSSVRRSFKRQYGITFLEMARQARLREAFNTLSEGNRVIDAQVGAGFESASAFRSAFARLLGTTPSGFSSDASLQACWFDTPLGAMIAVSDQRQLHLLEFSDRKALPAELRRLCGARSGTKRGTAHGQPLAVGFGKPPPSQQAESELQDFFSLRSDNFNVPLALHGTAFTQSVWRELQTIPAGQTRSYSELARALGRPAAVRAVARANGANQIAIIIPCHRVIGADGSLTGYGGGLWRKQKLIDLERRYL
jgi:AraC family transcriptional regulator of adaptative response/methylated-DNA-[protein]-cysteine methyltransferase